MVTLAPKLFTQWLSLTSRSSCATSFSSLRIPSNCTITIFMWLRICSLWLGVSEGSRAGAPLWDILHRLLTGRVAERWGQGQAEPRSMSGATGSRSATDPIWGSGRAGRVQHLKNAWAAERPRWVWGQASSCCVPRGISGMWLKRKVLESLKDG